MPTAGPRLGDIINSRGDIADLRDVFKSQAADARDRGEDVYVEDLIALSRKNDTAYVQPSDLEKAEWFHDLYTAEDEPIVHPRGLHYMILGKGYHRRNGELYRNTPKCWNEMKDGAFWAQVLGLVDPERILDEKNNPPRGISIQTDPQTGDVANPAPDRDRALAGDRADDVNVDTGYDKPRIPDTPRAPALAHDSADGLFKQEIERIVDRAFRDLSYDVRSRQGYYIELWAEKSGVIDADLAREYGATIREAGGGEMSFTMCRDAVQIASARDQDLVVVVISDFDAKGHDMPKSVARKVEVEAALEDVHATVHHAAVTLEQVEEYGLPGEPSTEPRGLDERNTGALGYESHKEIFREYAGQAPVEIQAFSGREPDAYRDEIEQYLEPYHDDELAGRIATAVQDARVDVYQALAEAFYEHEADVDEALAELQDAIDAYESSLDGEFDAVTEGVRMLEDREEAVREDVELDEKRAALADAVDVEFRRVLDDVTLDLPRGAADGRSDALLDTERSLFEQLAAYKEFDVRY